MSPQEFKRAFFVKLGEGGRWEASSIQDDILRIGYPYFTLVEINKDGKEFLRKNSYYTKMKKGSITMDINALMFIVESTTESEIWITFDSTYLWWCRLGEPGIYEDSKSRYRKVSGKWSNKDIDGNLLYSNQISGRISKVQRFAGVVCQIKGDAFDDLKRLLNNESSDTFISIKASQSDLENKVMAGIQRLHPKDFEILVDLLFSKNWNRVSMLGDIMRGVDIELTIPITHDICQVQVKSSADKKVFEEYAAKFVSTHKGVRRFYFVVSTLCDYNDETVRPII